MPFKRAGESSILSRRNISVDVAPTLLVIAPFRPWQTPSAVSRAVWVAIGIIMALAWFAALDTRVLEHPDEGRYGEIAREMVVSGDYLTPRLNGLKYFEKPPLQYWFTAAVFNLFEVDEWTTRLAAISGGFLTILLVGLTLARLSSPLAGAYAAMVMASCVLAIFMSHYATLDAFFTGWQTLALCAFLRAQKSSLRTAVARNFMLLAYAGLAAATLTKGPVALVIAGGALVVYSLATRDCGPWKRLHLLPGAALFLALVAPWFILVSRVNPEFAHFFFIHEHVERFLTTEHHRAGPWYYFIPIFAIGVTPWLLVWGATVARSWRDTTCDVNGFDWGRFCVAWAVLVFVFFSASGSKLPSYILPLFPAVAMLLGRELERIAARTLWWLSIPQVLLSLAFLLFMLFGYGKLVTHLADADTPAALFVAYGPWLVRAGIAFVVGAIAASWLFHRATPRAKALGIFASALGALVGFQIAFVGHNVFSPIRSAAGVVRALGNLPADGRMDPTAPVFQVGTYDQTFPFYLGGTTTMVHFRDELALGLDAEPQKGYATYPRWILDWKALPQGYALMKPDTYEFLAAQGVPMRLLARDPRRIVVARR